MIESKVHHCRYVHILGDAYPILTDPCLGLSGEYPWAMTIATAASLLTFTLEHILRRVIRRSNQQSLNAQLPDTESVCSSKDEEAAAMVASDAAERAETLEHVVVAITFEAGIVFHSETLPAAINDLARIMQTLHCSISHLLSHFFLLRFTWVYTIPSCGYFCKVNFNKFI